MKSEKLILIWFKEKRLNKNLTKKELAKIAGVHESLMGKYENGLRRPPPEKAQILGNILDFDWRLFYEGDPTP